MIVSIGRLERYKGHHRVLAALPYIQKKLPDARLLILGAGPYEATLRRLAARLGVADSTEIRMIPPADRAGMATTLASVDVVALLSEYEAHPVAAMEALVARRPILVADTSGLRELAEAHLARAIPLHSAPADVARAILAQLSDPLIPTDVAIPTWQDCADALLAIYERIIRRIPVRILMLSQFYPPIIGGEERHVRTLSAELHARGHEVAVATLWHDDLPEFEVESGVRIYRIRGLFQRIPGIYSERERPHAPPLPDPEAVAGVAPGHQARAPRDRPCAQLADTLVSAAQGGEPRPFGAHVA